MSQGFLLRLGPTHPAHGSNKNGPTWPIVDPYTDFSFVRIVLVDVVVIDLISATILLYFSPCACYFVNDLESRTSLEESNSTNL
jgi:hypothetical protein